MRVQLAISLALCLGGAAVRAQPSQTILTADAIVRAGPAGAMLVAGLTHRWFLADGDSALWQGRTVDVGFTAGVNPAYSQLGVFAQWLPIALLQLRVEYDAYGFFGANGALVKVTSAAAPFGTSDLNALPAKSAFGQRLLFSPTLRARAGRFVLGSQLDLALFALSNDDGTYYEWEYDTLVQKHDLVLGSKTSALLEAWRGADKGMFLIGPTYELTHAVQTGVTRERLGATLLLIPGAHKWGLDGPHIFAYGGVNLSDRNRSGALFLVAGVGTGFDL